MRADFFLGLVEIVMVVREMFRKCDFFEFSLMKTKEICFDHNFAKSAARISIEISPCTARRAVDFIP